MTIGEFQNHTDMYPDFTLYEAACKEYEKKNPDGSPAWDSQAQFCNAYKFNEDGLAERIMHSANERVESWISDNVRLKSELEPLADRCEKLVAENNRLEDENENLRNEIGALADRVDELNDEVDGMSDIRTAMFRAEGEMLAEFSRKDVGMAHIAFDYLLKELGVMQE